MGFVVGPIGIGVPFESNWCGRFVVDVVIRRPTYIPQYSLSVVQMNVTRCLHKLAKKANRVVEVGSSDGEVDQASD